MSLRPRHRSWTGQETEQLRAHIARGGSAARAAVMFRRTQGAVRAHAAACGLKFPTISELRRRASGTSSATPREVITPLRETMLAQPRND